MELNCRVYAPIETIKRDGNDPDGEPAYEVEYGSNDIWQEELGLYFQCSKCGEHLDGITSEQELINYLKGL